MKNNLIKTLFFFFIILASIISIIDFYCFDDNFYKNEYTKLNTAQSMNLSEEDLNNMTDDLLDYLRSEKPDLSLTITLNGEKREAFNERETIHMKDVKDLYDKVMLVRNISLCMIVIFGTIIFKTSDFKNLFVSYKKVLFFFLSIFLTIGLLCLIDFDFFWTNFHLLFFSKNDYWLLDPRTSLLINMVPSEFFFDLCIRIVVTIIVTITCITYVIKLVDKKGIAND